MVTIDNTVHYTGAHGQLVVFPEGLLIYYRSLDGSGKPLTYEYHQGDSHFSASALAKQFIRDGFTVKRGGVAHHIAPSRILQVSWKEEADE